ncbi:unnamed protein product [Cylicostephanus goldi]|uniref:Tyrosine-protein phosphatase domain-containing protein n=1 Tax=Cylicostephanus goldi TaxID=71465 RepID=A0A3P7Q7G4_CYLGO|nr:unnamed protein product [Cylicostephanus goldi]
METLQDVGCLDNDRVVLHIGPVSYIHANYVTTPMNAKRFICTQAPLPKTCPEFWYMVVQENCTAICMLCNFIEQRTKKCAEYFPTEEGPPLVFEGNVSVQLKRQYPVSANTDYFEPHVQPGLCNTQVRPYFLPIPL